MSRYPADGISTGKVVLDKNLCNSDDFLVLPRGFKHLVIISHIKEVKREHLIFKSSGSSGDVVFTSKNGYKLKIRFYPVPVDIDKDGFPDSSELLKVQDRKSFVDWFVRIAESQFLKRNYSWNINQRDCAGFIRYCYREALKKHDEKWFHRSGIVVDKNLPDVCAFNYPDIPVISKNIFKIKKGNASDLSTFGAFADAETMIKFNTFLVDMDINRAKNGDILFFQDVSNPEYPYHSMIINKKSDGKIFLLYHTGSGDVVKRVPLSYLAKSHNFRPVRWNKKFLGVYRLHILENKL
jgi:uncharacterized protein YfaT (DUF1175 family)